MSNNQYGKYRSKYISMDSSMGISGSGSECVSIYGKIVTGILV